MNYIYLQKDNKIPSVGVAQQLLNEMGGKLSVDGIFGAKTKNAVMDFQRSQKIGVDGVIGEITWPMLAANRGLSICDCIDVFDVKLEGIEPRAIRRVGGNPILIGGMCNGVEQAVNEIMRTVEDNVFLLRFHGHGVSGVVGISDGKGLSDGVDYHSSIDNSNVKILMPILRRLAPIFGPYGNIQFMHCSTGLGKDGRNLLSQIARGVGVPVTAATRDQIGGGVSTFKFEGPTFTAFPNGETLAGWCRSRPSFR